MKTFKTILVPTDFGGAAKAALDRADELAGSFGAEVVLLHAFELHLSGFPEMSLAAAAALGKRLFEGPQARLDALVDAHAASGVIMRTLVEDKDPREAILDAARREHVDLIVMGTHGRRGAPRAFLGSVGAIALELAADRAPGLVITDLRMPGTDGLSLLAKLHERDKDLPVIVATGTADIDSAIAAMRAGAADFVAKPIDLDVLDLVITRAIAHRDAKSEAETLRLQLREQHGHGLQSLIGTSPVMQKVYRTARQVSGSQATVLITGESGTGKGEVARAIHALGPDPKRPFVALHCAALPESLLETELFGHEKGSFTGADRRRIGRFEQANGGTLFLDEIGEIPALTQVKLLKVLQDRTFERLGSNQPIHVDVRVIAATNRDLAADVRAGRFRDDLFYRLNVVELAMPPLRVRGDDILALAEHFLNELARENGKRIDGFTEKAREKLLMQRWPGNVRELENTIERAIILAPGPLIDVHDLPLEVGPEVAGTGIRIPGSTMAGLERHAILKTLDACDGSTVRAAELLGISVRTIQYRLREYGAARPSRAPSPAVRRSSPPSTGKHA